MAALKRDNFGNPIYGQTITYMGYDISFPNETVRNAMFDKVFSDDEATTMEFCNALLDRWHNYGIQSPNGFSADDDKAVTEMFSWLTNLDRTAHALWRRYKGIVEAYKTKVDWASGIINTTTYQDVKDTSDTHGDSTDWALPNKKVGAPYGTPTSHSQNGGSTTNLKTGAVETKGMLNPVTQRDLYARLIRDAFGEMAEECAPLFNQMHL